MDFDGNVFTWGVSGALSAGVAFGIIKSQIRNCMTYETHREICAKERAETNKALGDLYQAQKEAHGMIKEIHGYMKAQNGGSL